MLPENTALLIIDVQENLASQMHQKEELFKNLYIITRGAQILDLPILMTEQAPEKIGKTIPQIHQPLKNIKPITKLTFSCCGEEQFIKALEKIKRENILIAGIEAHVCVYQTAIDLMQRGHTVHVISDAVSARTRENKNVGLSRIKAEGGVITSTETALCELLKEAKGKKFKEILQLIK